MKKSEKIKEDLYFDFEYNRSNINWQKTEERYFVGNNSDGVIFLLKDEFGKDQKEGANIIRSKDKNNEYRPKVLFLVQKNEANPSVSETLKKEAQAFEIGEVVIYDNTDTIDVKVKEFAEPLIKEKKKKGLMKWLLLLMLPLIIAVVGVLLLFFGKREINPTLPVNENPIAETYVKGSRAKNNSTVNNPPPGNPSEIVPGNKDDNSKHTPSQSIVPPEKPQPAEKKTNSTVWTDELKLEKEFVYIDAAAKGISGKDIPINGKINGMISGLGLKATANKNQALWVLSARGSVIDQNEVDGFFFAWVNIDLEIINTVTGDVIHSGSLADPVSARDGIKGGSVTSYDDAVSKAYQNSYPLIQQYINKIKNN
ncbi:MAG: hypothetical protein IK103_00680 [Bacteroidales bacterium]|nr:hypothetical protein [Bacteroidales bacterium]